MKQKLTVYELGKLLKEVTDTYNTSILAKINLSGGWMTMQGQVEVLSIPTDKVVLKGNNIITLKIKSQENEGTEMKITGAKDGSFEVAVAPKRVIEIRTGSLGLQVQKEKADECTIKIDDSMIFNVNTVAENVEKLLSK
ncbi:MAG: UDP-N-acetylglucosamine pyrophosphorylase [Clostridium sp.]